mgnify:CR=1 FL=1
MLKVKSNLRVFFICIIIAFVCLFGYLLFQNFCAELFIRWKFEERTTLNLFKNGFWNAFIIVAIIYPVLEELIFRLFACRLLNMTKLPVWAVVLISAVIFMLYHWSWSQVVYQLLMGIWLAWIFMKTRNIGWAVLIHFINNAFIVTYTYLTGVGDSVFELNAGNIILSISLAVVTTIVVIFLIKKGIPHYEK